MPSSRSIILAPITVGVVWTACFMYVAVLFRAEDHANQRNPHKESQRDLGAVLSLVQFNYTASNDGKIKPIPLASGPLDLWDGQLWRVPINALHHGNLLHLLMNGCAMLFMGKILEPRLGKFRMFLFLVLAAVVSSTVQTLVDTPGVGLSGVAFAQVGLLMVWRDRDEEVAEAVPYGVVILSGVWLVGCQLVTYADLIHIGNTAHYSGLIYGWLFGQAYLSSLKSPLPRFLFVVGHVFLIPTLWFTVNPFWSGNWHWYRSSGTHVSEQQRLERLQAAVLYDPTLAGAWNQLTIELIHMDDLQAAFRVALEGFRHNPEDSEILDKIVTIWAEAQLNERPFDADTFIEQTFEVHTDSWKEMLHSKADPFINRLKWQAEDLEKLFGLNPNVESIFPAISTETFSAPVPDPNAPESALGGVAM